MPLETWAPSSRTPWRTPVPPNTIPPQRGGSGKRAARSEVGLIIRGKAGMADLAMEAPCSWCKSRACQFLLPARPSSPARDAAPPTLWVGDGSRPCAPHRGGDSVAWSVAGHSVSTPGRPWRALGIPTGGRNCAGSWYSRPPCGRRHVGWAWLHPRPSVGVTGPFRPWPIIGSGRAVANWVGREQGWCRRRAARFQRERMWKGNLPCPEPTPPPIQGLRTRLRAKLGARLRDRLRERQAGRWE